MNTATTPGIAARRSRRSSAMPACAIDERTKARCSTPSIGRSSTNCGAAGEQVGVFDAPDGVTENRSGHARPYRGTGPGAGRRLTAVYSLPVRLQNACHDAHFSGSSAWVIIGLPGKWKRSATRSGCSSTSAA